MAAADEVELVIARLRALPDDALLSIGGTAPLTKEQLIEHVRKSDDIGQRVIEAHLSYLRGQKLRVA